MNDSNPEVELQVSSRKLSPSQGLTNSVIIVAVHIKSEEIFINLTTGHHLFSSISISGVQVQTTSERFSMIHSLTTIGLCDHLASEISASAINLGFGYNGFTLSVAVKVTYKSVTVTSNDQKSLRMVLLRRMKAEELKSLKMETESCSICLENLTCPKRNELTRMTCSHVFHSHCLLEWLERKNTCPLCRTLLY